MINCPLSLSVLEKRLETCRTFGAGVCIRLPVAHGLLLQYQNYRLGQLRRTGTLTIKMCDFVTSHAVMHVWYEWYHITGAVCREG